MLCVHNQNGRALASNHCQLLGTWKRGRSLKHLPHFARNCGNYCTVASAAAEVDAASATESYGGLTMSGNWIPQSQPRHPSDPSIFGPPPRFSSGNCYSTSCHQRIQTQPPAQNNIVNFSLCAHLFLSIPAHESVSHEVVKQKCQVVDGCQVASSSIFVRVYRVHILGNKQSCTWTRLPSHSDTRDYGRREKGAQVHPKLAHK